MVQTGYIADRPNRRHRGSGTAPDPHAAGKSRSARPGAWRSTAAIARSSTGSERQARCQPAFVSLHAGGTPLLISETDLCSQSALATIQTLIEDRGTGGPRTKVSRMSSAVSVKDVRGCTAGSEDRAAGLMDSGAPGIGLVPAAGLRHCPQSIASHEAPFWKFFWVEIGESDRKIRSEDQFHGDA